jgi:plasmid maintenance system antidote protein VapI/Zn-dependent peptidase ImmA (M78 family)
LAYILGTPEQAVNMIISGKRGISPEMAKALGNAFEVSGEFFANLQKAYEMANARAPDPQVARRAQLQRLFPVREMIRRGWLEDTDIGLLEAQVKRFFCANDLEEVAALPHAAKKSDYSETTAPQLAWLYRVRQLAAEMVVPRYSEKALRDLLAELPRYMIDPEEMRLIPRALAECGIRFVIVEALPNAKIDGVCFWLDAHSPVIGLSTLRDRIDNFWFVLRHELEHVLNGDGKDGVESAVLDVDVESAQDDSLPPEEKRANAAAAELCVPREELETFYLRKFPYISERDMLGFAGRIQRHPGIVVGQLQKKMDRWDWLSRYKVKVRQYIAQESVIDGWGVPASVSL